MTKKPITIRTGKTDNQKNDLMFLGDNLQDAGFINKIHDDYITMDYPDRGVDLLIALIEEILPTDFTYSIVIGTLDMSQQFDDKITFGKHSGKTVSEVLKIDPSWIIWANKNVVKFNVSKETIGQAWDAVKNKKK